MNCLKIVLIFLLYYREVYKLIIFQNWSCWLGIFQNLRVLIFLPQHRGVCPLAKILQRVWHAQLRHDFSRYQELWLEMEVRPDLG